MSSDKDCKKLNISCSKLRNKCEKNLGDAIGPSTNTNAKKCKTALGNDAKKEVEEFCKITCNECGKFISN